MTINLRANNIEEQTLITSPTQGGFTDGKNVFKHMVVVSGYASSFTPDPLEAFGDSGSESFRVDMLVGPLWTSIHEVAPMVVRSGFYLNYPDEADVDGYRHRRCRWKLVDVDGGKRIRLRATLGIVANTPDSAVAEITFGGNGIPRLAFRLTAIGNLRAKRPGS